MGGIRRKSALTSGGLLVLATTAGLLPAISGTGGAAAGTLPPLPAQSTSLPTQWFTPNGWRLTPAGTQVLTEREPTGLAVAPDGSAIYTVSSGIFEEGVERIDAQSLVAVPTLVGDLWLGVTADGAGNVYASGGGADQVYRFTEEGPALVDAGPAGPVPSIPASQGTHVLGFPGTLLLSGTSGDVKNKLFVAGNISIPQSAIDTADSNAGPCPNYPANASDPICSVVSVLDVTSPSSPVVRHLIPVGRDAYGMAFSARASTLYVANWADRTNPNVGTGTVSVVHLSSDGSESAIQTVDVGLDPTGVALSSDGTKLAVTNSGSDSVSLFSVDPLTGNVTLTTTVSVGVGSKLGTQPTSAAWSSDGNNLFVAVAGLNAIEVLDSGGRPVSQQVSVQWLGNTVSVTSPATYIPVGQYPDALAFGPDPNGSGGSRLYSTNLYGMGAGPGFNGQAEPLNGTRTQGSLSAIDIPSESDAGPTLNQWTAQVVANDDLAPLDDSSLTDPATNPCTGAPLPGGSTIESGLLCDASGGRLDPRDLHVIDVLDENKTFDSYFGDSGTYFSDVNADPAYAVYPYGITTNHHLIGQQYNLSDNFYNEGFNASVVGHPWFESGTITPYTNLIWAQSYDPENLRGNRLAGDYSANAAGGVQSDPNVAAEERAMDTPPQSIFDLVQSTTNTVNPVSERIYSTDWSPTTSAAKADQAPAWLWGQGPNPVGSGDDETMPDVDRVSLFLSGQFTSHTWNITKGAPPSTFDTTVGYCGGPLDGGGYCSYPGARSSDYSNFSLAAWSNAYNVCRTAGSGDAICQKDMPNFSFMVLPENAGGLVDTDTNLNPLDATPQSMVADNDEAVGQLVEGLSRSPFWKDTVVFVTEDDTQVTGDHVDASRTYLLAAGGLVRLLGPNHEVSHQQGSFSSVLKTTEVLLGLPQMTLFDSMSVPLGDVIGDSVPPSPPTYSAQQPLFPALASPPQAPTP